MDCTAGYNLRLGIQNQLRLTLEHFEIKSLARALAGLPTGFEILSIFLDANPTRKLALVLSSNKSSAQRTPHNNKPIEDTLVILGTYY